MTILVTGATGNVGRQVIQQLIQRGAKVRALVRNPASANLPNGVEVVQGDRTSAATIEKATELMRAMGKTPARAKDTPGFIVNRVARPFYNEGLRILGDGDATVETIDRIMKEAGNFRMGPFELMDLIGNDINFAATESLYRSFFEDPRFRPSPIQQRMVMGNNLGRKTGRGFYTYGKK